MKIHFAVLLLAAAFSCSRPERAEMADMIAVPATEQKAQDIDDRKLIREGRIEFETDNLSSARETILEAVQKYNGYVSSDQEFKSPGRLTNTLVIRIPADNFDRFLEEAAQGIKRFDSREINISDVTEEFLDIQARLKTKKELESRYLEILKQARNVADVLEVEKQIGQLRSEIESIEGRMQYLQNRVSYSTLTIVFYERIPLRPEFVMKFKNGFVNGWNNLILFFVALVNIWPFILIGLASLFLVRYYRRRK